MEYIASIVWIGLEILCVLKFCSAFLKSKQGTWKKIIGVLLIWSIIYAYSNTQINGIIKPIISIVVLSCLSIWMFNGKPVFHFFLVAVCYIFIAIIDTVVVNGTCLLLDISYLDLVWRKYTYLTVITIDKLIAVLVAWIICQFFSSEGTFRANSKWLALMILFPATSIIMFAILVYNSNKSGDLSISIVVFASILATANIGILYIVASLEKATRREQEMGMLRQQIVLQAANYTALKENFGAQRKATHEFKRHIQTLGDLLKHDEYSTAKQYVSQLQSNRALDMFSINSKHAVFDVILNQKYQVAKEHGIYMQVQVSDLSEVPLQTDMVVVLLSNLLDNAIEACQRISKRKEIYCRIIMDDVLSIVIRNTSPEIEISNGNIKSSKPNPTEHGYGLPAVKYILNELGAEYTFEYSNGWFTFVAEIAFG